jgi:catechol 2,3-dioxygenase-like lactoylglutathione lyase family enzyme
MPHVEAIGESALYVADVERSAHFYEELLRLEKIRRDDRFCALRVNKQQVLLLFNKGATLQPVSTPGGVIPPHDGAGQLHLAFTVSERDWEEWKARLQSSGLNIESQVEWGRGTRSLYFRDPDGHLIELATPGLWDED